MPTIIYNGQTLPNPYSKFTYNEDEKSITVSCQFIATAASSSSLVSTCQTLEEKLTEINKDFSLTFDATSELSFSHSGNTGFLARPKLNKVNNKFATATSRPYSFSVNIQLPFAQTPYNYRREGSFSVSYSPNKQKTITFRMVYTAGGVDTAITKYQAVTGGKAWAATVLAAFGGTYEIITENLNQEQEEKILNATLVYKEILATQNGSTLNDTQIVDPSCNYSVSFAQEVGISKTGGYTQIPMVTVTISYNVTVDKEVIPSENDIEAVYEITVKPWLIAHAYDVLGLDVYSDNTAGTDYIIQAENKTVDPYSYRFSGNLTFMAPKKETQIIHLSEKIKINDDLGVRPQKYWDGIDHTNGTWSIGKVRTMQRIIVISQLEVEPNPPRPYPPENKGVWLMLNRTKDLEVTDLGRGMPAPPPGVRSSELYTVTYFESYMFIIPVSGKKYIDVKRMRLD